MDRIDFRSDTVSWPTPEMREAMATAQVGDDVFRDDPTVNRLEALSAERTGKEAGLFVTSGTQGNLVAVLGHAQRGDEAILGVESHVYLWEVGGMSSFGGIFPRTVPVDASGRMDPTAVESAVRDSSDHHLGHSRLLLVENTFGGRGGRPLPADYFTTLKGVADRHGLAVHLDGARLFNAAVALGVEASTLTADVDTVTFCLSKGLCAPVGSMLCGPADFIEEARRTRKALGGGMRQAGIVAAAGLVALESMVERLADDHAHARMLAEKLATIDGIRIAPETVETNIVFFELEPDVALTPVDVCRQVALEHSILLDIYTPEILRAITHYWVGEQDVDRLVNAIATVIS